MSGNGSHDAGKLMAEVRALRQQNTRLQQKLAEARRKRQWGGGGRKKKRKAGGAAQARKSKPQGTPNLRLEDYAATAICDGGITQNPGGDLYWSVALLDPSGSLMEEHRQPPYTPRGERTNNVAEYRAAIDAARLLLPYAEAGGRAQIVTDSRILCQGMRKRWSLQPHLHQLIQELGALMDRGGIELRWAPRKVAVQYLGH